MEKRYGLLLAVVALIVSSAFLSERNVLDVSSVQIGTQIWSNTNLNTDTFRNGDFIPYMNTNEAWKKAGEEKKPAFCYYGDDPANMYTPYGKLYNWYAVNDPRGLAPAGWHVPSDSEWTVLSNYLGGYEVAGKKLKASNYEWYKGGEGSNESKFSAVPGSYRWPSGVFLPDATSAHFWTSSELKSDEYENSAWEYSLGMGDKISRSFNNNENGMSVRLVKDKSDSK